MMVPKSTSWLLTVFKYRGTELPRTQRRILGVLILSIIVTVIEELSEDTLVDLTVVPFTLTGVALSIFLGFRNNAAYERWWDGRKIWGALVNTTRTTARQILTLVGPSDLSTVSAADREAILALRKELVYRVIAFTYTLKLALRDDDNLGELAPFLSAEEIESLKRESNRVSAITAGTAERLRAAFDKGWIHPIHLSTLEGSLTALTDQHGGCERIKGTPIPFSYTTLIHRIVAFYCYGLPFGLVSSVKHFTPLVVVVVSYAFFGLDTVGDEIEQPFGTDANDLPLNAISRMIEVNLRQRLGETELPPLLRPVDELLL